MRILQLLAGIVIATVSTGMTIADDVPASIGSRLELFLDHSLVQSTSGVNFRLHHPVKAPRPKSPLPVRHYITVIKDGDLFRAYWKDHNPDFTPTGDSEGGEMVAYAESRDGHEWSFPKLGIHEIAGSKENNAILINQPGLLHNFVPFLDNRPGVAPAEKFKALSGHPGPGDKRTMDVTGKGLYAFTSPDGIHWTKGSEVIPYEPEWRHAFDSANVSFWSEAEQQYVCYFRTWSDPDRLRSVSRTTSKDFKTWTKPVAMNPNLPGEHLYTTQTHPYFRAPHLYIALPTRYVPGRGDDGHGTASERNATDILLMSTRAGSAHYDRPFTEAFIRPGLDPKRWENRANYVALGIHPTGPAEISIYHRSGDRYLLRTDGFVSARAGSKQGELLTKPFTFSGDTLELNVSTSAAGFVKTEIQNAAGEPVPGFELESSVPLFDDGIALKASWKSGSDLSSLTGKTVQLKFHLLECDLYSYRFTNTTGNAAP
ncbi:hypothetical protein VSU19_15870 [Verrucomicrobiales bacterium BCK34]|nr:hypothetical protein [Verrucomicrobiales bacterium BCK34]